MAQQTALQELIAWGDDMLLNHPQKLLSFGEAIDKAVSLLEKEKEQMEKCYNHGATSLIDMGHGESFEEYYAKTHGE
jgi:hypothetical protein